MPNFNSYTYLQAKSMLSIISLQVCITLVFGAKSKVNTLMKRITKSKQAPISGANLCSESALMATFPATSKQGEWRKRW